MTTAEESVAAACRAMTMAGDAMRAFTQACAANDWDAAERHRAAFQDAMDAHFDHIAAAHRLLAESNG